MSQVNCTLLVNLAIRILQLRMLKLEDLKLDNLNILMLLSSLKLMLSLVLILDKGVKLALTHS